MLSMASSKCEKDNGLSLLFYMLRNLLRVLANTFFGVLGIEEIN